MKPCPAASSTSQHSLPSQTFTSEFADCSGPENERTAVICTSEDAYMSCVSVLCAIYSFPCSPFHFVVIFFYFHSSVQLPAPPPPDTSSPLVSPLCLPSIFSGMMSSIGLSIDPQWTYCNQPASFDLGQGLQG